MKKYAFSVVIIALLCGFAACNWETDGIDVLNDLYPDGDMTAEEELEAVEISEVAGSTTWAMMEELHATVDPMGTGPELVVIVNLFVATMDDSDMVVSRQACAWLMDPIMTMDTSIPDAGLAKMDVPDMTFVDDGSEAFEALDHVWTWGVDLENPNTDALPDNTEDSRIYDQDSDSQPAVTVQVHSSSGKLMGDRYMVRRSRKDYVAANFTDDPDWFVGKVEFALDDFVVGATNSMIEISPPQLTDEEADNHFVMRRMPQDTTCEDIVKLGKGLFIQESAEGEDAQ